MEKPLAEMSIEELWQLFPIYLTEPHDEWAEWYEEEVKYLRQILPLSQIQAMNHIGSTAIKGIWAKPIIDILVELVPGAERRTIRDILMNNGYICMLETEKRISLNKGYTDQGFAEKVYHIHIRWAGDNDELYFRDYLNSHPEMAKQYEALKLKLWKLYEHNRDAYTEHKSEFVADIMKQAKT